MNLKLYKRLEIAGFFVVYLLAVFLHYIYDLSECSVLSILFGAVNESVWEHVKIFSAGYVLWAIITLLWARPPFYKYVVAKTISLYFLMLSIIVFFYTYNLFTDSPILALDIISSIVFVALAQYLSYRLTVSDNNISEYFVVAVMLLMLFFVMFFSFTVFPPQCDLFRDPITGTYGIPQNTLENCCLIQ